MEQAEEQEQQYIIPPLPVKQAVRLHTSTTEQFEAFYQWPIAELAVDGALGADEGTERLEPTFVSRITDQSPKGAVALKEVTNATFSFEFKKGATHWTRNYTLLRVMLRALAIHEDTLLIGPLSSLNEKVLEVIVWNWIKTVMWND